MFLVSRIARATPRTRACARRCLSHSAHCAPYPQRTHTCGQLEASQLGEQVVLAGWLLPGRKGKAVSFFPLKDSSGTTQLVLNHTNASPAVSALSAVPPESTVIIEGTVLSRPSGAMRAGPTGEIEVQVDAFTLLNPATALPFLPSSPHNLPNEDIRLRHRYLDIRRTILSENLQKRSKVAHIIRNNLNEAGFVEVETPVLLRSSSEGAREFLVPTRSVGEVPLFYALQQSPQQPKQLLICSGGVDKYFQIAKCFRDEDGRKDRQPEFTQIDIEMAFVSWGDTQNSPVTDRWNIGGHEVREVTENLIRKVWQDVKNICLPKSFTVMTYRDSMSRFGSDKPDTRFGLFIHNLNHHIPVQNHFLNEKHDVLECIIVKRHDQEFIKASQSCTATNTEHIALHSHNIDNWLFESGLASRIYSHLSQDDIKAVNKVLDIQVGDDVWLASRPNIFRGGCTTLGKVRLRISELAQELGHFAVTLDPHFLWVTEFPLFTRSDEDKKILAKGRWSSSHHPFTAPMWKDISDLYHGEIENLRGQHYDLVLNGVEIGGGSVRIHDAAMQSFIFSKILQLNETENEPFDQLLHALQCGAPPHGGIALGFDRIMAILCDAPSIRDVIAFPKSGSGMDLLFRSPAAVDNEALSQYSLKSSG